MSGRHRALDGPQSVAGLAACGVISEQAADLIRSDSVGEQQRPSVDGIGDGAEQGGGRRVSVFESVSDTTNSPEK